MNKSCNTHVGETNIANNGQKMTIIKYDGYKEVTVQFEDGTVVEGRSYNNFKKGQVANPNVSSMTKKRKSEKAEVNKTSDIKNETNKEVKENPKADTNKDAKEKSSLTAFQEFAKKKIGETKVMLSGMPCTIIAYRSVSDIDVKFRNGRVVHKCPYSAFLRGVI